MSDIIRVRYSLQHVMGKSVGIIPWSDWRTLVRGDGTPTLLAQAPGDLAGIYRQASQVTVTASGIGNPDPGLDIIRTDLKDAPYIYNIDHYVVLEKLSAHKAFAEALKIAGLMSSSQLTSFVDGHAFFVGPYDKEFALHWCKVIPPHIQAAKRKHDP